MTWAAKVAAKNNSQPRSNGLDQKKEESVVFKPEAANGASINVGKTNLSFGSFSDDKKLANPVPQRKNSVISVSLKL